MLSHHRIIICQNVYCVHIRIAILYHAAKFKSANTVVWGQIAKFNDRQYSWLYGDCYAPYRFAYESSFYTQTFQHLEID